MFPKSSVFAVVALAAFVSLGALLFPQVGQAQEGCIWDCDLGSDFFNFPGENSPGFSIVYCFDQPCVATLNTNFNIFTGAIPTAHVQQSAPGLTCDGNTLNTITISGKVIAVAKTNGVFNPASAAEALFNIVVNKVICSADQTLSSTIGLADSPGAVIGGSITILNIPILNAGNSELTKPNGWPGCRNDKQGNLLACSYPLGNDQSKTLTELLAKFPATEPPLPSFAERELYHGNASGRAVSTRMCKGPANQSSVDCKVGQDVAVGGFVADGVFKFDGNWSGSGDKTFNPKSSTGPFDIGPTPLFDDIDFTDQQHPVTASANGGTPIPAAGCNTMNNAQTLRCSFSARDLLPNGCKTGETVNIVVSGNVSLAANPNGFVKFLSTDSPTCNNGK